MHKHGLALAAAGAFLFGAISTGTATANAQEKQRYDAKTAAGYFGKRRDVEDISLSDDGKRIAIISGGKHTESTIYWVPLEGGTLQEITASDGQEAKFRWCDFVASDRLICNLNVQQKMSLGRNGSELVDFTRMVSVTTDGSDFEVLGQSRSINAGRQAVSGGAIISWMPSEQGQVLYAQEYTPDAKQTNTRLGSKLEGLGVTIVDARSGQSKRLENPHEDAFMYLADGEDVRIRGMEGGYAVAGNLTGQTSYYYRKKGSSSWERLSSFGVDTDEGVRGFSPAAIDGKNNRAIGYANVDGRTALIAVSLDGNFTKEMLFSHPEVDVGSLVRFGQDGRIVGVRYATDKTRIAYFDPEIKKLSRQLNKALPGLPIIEVIDASTDENVLLVFAASDSDPGRYYVLIKDKQELREVALARPSLESVALSKVQPITYSSRDGVTIPGYLTLPPGETQETAKNLPAIVMPHGGPASRDVWGFDYLAQYFAHIGYAVLQPNFRGSDGYGDDWFLDNGFKSWRTAINDVNDGAKWLRQSGVANPDRMAIVGWSYGGYAALQSDVVEDSLFKASVAVAPLTDMKDWVAEFENYTNYSIMKNYVGEGSHIIEGSPLQNAAAIDIPVLLFHGDKDTNVSYLQSVRMEKALKSAGRDVRYVEYEGLDHQLPSGQARANMLFQIADFLDEKLK